MDDSNCVACHADLKSHRQENGPGLAVASAVTQFDLAHHPDFTAASTVGAAGSGRIKFSHARHLAIGLPLQEGGKPFTYDSLLPADRARFGGKPDEPAGTPVHLVECMPCHQLDGDERARRPGGKPANSLPARTPGATMLPVTYEHDCRTCHPLQFEANRPKRQIPHGLSPREVVNELKQFYAAEAVKEDPALLRRTVAPRAVPGQAEPGGARIKQAIADKVLVGAKLLFGSGADQAVRIRDQLPLGRRGCVECHNVRPADRPLVSADDFASLEIEQVVTNALWFEHARFDHTAHRALECAACHAGTLRSTENPDPGLLPSIGQCVECHAPSSKWPGQARGGAGVACTECHRYHNGDHPAEGVGASARRGVSRMSIEQFMRGVPRR
jgi:hypothetical protein